MGKKFRVRTKRGTTESLTPISNFSRTSASDSRVHGPGDTCTRRGFRADTTSRRDHVVPFRVSGGSPPGTLCPTLSPRCSALAATPHLAVASSLLCSARLGACSLGRSLLLARRLSHQLPLPRPPAPQRRCLWQILATRLAEPLPVSGCQRPCHNGGDSGRRPNRTKTPGCFGRALSISH